MLLTLVLEIMSQIQSNFDLCSSGNNTLLALSLQEEMKEGAQTTMYDDFKFLTKEDLKRLNLTNLIGTNLLRAYMHGFFIDHRLYKKVTQPSRLCLLFVKEMMYHCNNLKFSISIYEETTS